MWSNVDSPLGSVFSNMPSPTSSILLAVWGNGPDVWAVGLDGAIVHDQ